MHVLCFSDFHFFKTRVDLQIKTCDWIADQIRELKPDVVANCGDTNHTHGYIDIVTLEAMTRGMKTVIDAAEEVGATTLFISGNHDQSSKDGFENAISAFENLASNVLCATTYPKVIKIKDEIIVLAPYCNPGDYEHLSKYIEIYKDLIEKEQPTFQLSHWEITGCEYMPNGKSSDHGIKAEDFLFPIINGHYHHPKTYKKRYNYIHIVGSPCYYNYSDKLADNPRGIMVFDTKTQTPEWIENPHTEIFHTASPTEIDSELLERLPKGRTNLRVRVDTPDDADALQELVGSLEKDDWKSLKLYNKLKTDLVVNEIKSLDFSVDKSYKDLLISYIKEKGSPNQDRLLQVGLEIIESACISSDSQ